MAYKIKDEEGYPITTKDGVSILGVDNYVDLKLEDFSDKERSFVAVANAESEDRFKDVIMVKGWQLENYRKNPVVMAFHQYQALPVGRSLEEFTKKVKGVNTLFFRPQFAAYPDTMRMYEMYRDKYLKGFSVGFIPLEEEPIKSNDEDDEEGGFFFHEPTRYLKQELLENSVAPVPAHPDALAEIKGMVQKGQIYIPAKYLQKEQGKEIEIYDKYIHVKFADEDKFLDLYVVEMTSGISRVFGHQKEEDESELFDYKFIFSREIYSEDQVMDLAEMLSKEKYEEKNFKAYDPEIYSAKEPIIIELLVALKDKDFDIEVEKKTETTSEEVTFDYLVCTVCNHWEGYRDEEDPKCPKCDAKMVASNEKVYKAEETFKCECIDCGKKVTSAKHCDTYKCPECGGEMRRVERPGPGKSANEKSEFNEVADNVYVYQTEEMLDEEAEARIMERFKKIFGDDLKLMILGGGASLGKLGELNFDVDLTKDLIDKMVERLTKVIKGVVRKEKTEVGNEDGVIIELEEPEEGETFELDKDELRGMVSDTFKNVLGQLD